MHLTHLEMAGLMRRLVFPVCRRLHQGAVSALIPRNTYCSAQTEQLSEEEETRLKNIFNQYDEDGSGHITQDELYTILNDILHNKSSAMHIVHKIMDDCDKDDSGCIDFDEFKHGMKSYMEFFLHEE